jgi:hypothetical protein
MPSKKMRHTNDLKFIPPMAADEFDPESSIFEQEDLDLETAPVPYYRCKLCPSNWLDEEYIHDHCTEVDHIQNVRQAMLEQYPWGLRLLNEIAAATREIHELEHEVWMRRIRIPLCITQSKEPVVDDRLLYDDIRRYRLMERLCLIELVAWKNVTIAKYGPKTNDHGSHLQYIKSRWKKDKEKVRMTMDKSDNAIAVIVTAVQRFIEDN